MGWNVLGAKRLGGELTKGRNVQLPAYTARCLAATLGLYIPNSDCIGLLMKVRWMGAVPDLSASWQPASAGRQRPHSLCSTPPSSLSSRRNPVLPESGLLQRAARMWFRLSRVHTVAVFHHASHQLYSQPSAEWLGRAGLETRTSGVAYLSSDPVSVFFVRFHSGAAAASLLSTMRGALSQVPRQTVHAPYRSRQAVANQSTTVQSSAACSTVHVSRHRFEETDGTHPVQILVPRSVPEPFIHFFSNLWSRVWTLCERDTQSSTELL